MGKKSRHNSKDRVKDSFNLIALIFAIMMGEVSSPVPAIGDEAPLPGHLNLNLPEDQQFDYPTFTPPNCMLNRSIGIASGMLRSSIYEDQSLPDAALEALENWSYDKPCGNASGVNTKHAECSTFTSKSSGFNLASFNRIKEDVERQLGALICQQQKIEFASNSISCLRDTRTALENQMGALSSFLNARQEEAKDNVQLIDNVGDDVIFRMNEVSEILNGDQGNANGENPFPVSGRPGLLSTRNYLQNLLSGSQQVPTLPSGMNFDQAIDHLDTGFKNNDLNRKRFETVRQMRIADLTKQCMTNPLDSMGSYKCYDRSRGSKDEVETVSTQQGIECKIHDHFLKARGGRPNKTDLQEARNKVAAYNGAMARMFSRIQELQVPTSVEGLETFDERRSGKISLDSIMTNQVKRELFKVDKRVYAEVKNRVAQCFRRAQVNVYQGGEDGGKLETLKLAITEERKALKTNYTKAIETADDGIFNAMRALTLNPNVQRINIAACTGSKLSTASRTKCLKKARQYLDMILKGPPNGQSQVVDGEFAFVNAKFPIRGTGEPLAPGVPSIGTHVIECAGLLRCEVALQNASRGLKLDLLKVKKQKSQYVRSFNKQYQRALKTPHQMLSYLSRSIRQQLDHINGGLGGLMPQISMKPVQAMPVPNPAFANGEEQLLDLQGQNLKHFIAGNLQPPLIDIDTNLEEFTTNLASQQTLLASKADGARAMATLMENMPRVCTLGAVHEGEVRMRQIAEDVKGCRFHAQFCEVHDINQMLIDYGEIEGAEEFTSARGILLGFHRGCESLGTDVSSFSFNSSGPSAEDVAELRGDRDAKKELFESLADQIADLSNELELAQKRVDELKVRIAAIDQELDGLNRTPATNVNETRTALESEKSQKSGELSSAELKVLEIQRQINAKTTERVVASQNMEASETRLSNSLDRDQPKFDELGCDYLATSLIKEFRSISGQLEDAQLEAF